MRRLNLELQQERPEAISRLVEIGLKAKGKIMEYVAYVKQLELAHWLIIGDWLIIGGCAFVLFGVVGIAFVARAIRSCGDKWLSHLRKVRVSIKA